MLHSRNSQSPHSTVPTLPCCKQTLFLAHLPSEELITQFVHNSWISHHSLSISSFSEGKNIVPVTAKNPTVLQKTTDPRNYRWEIAPSLCSTCFISWGLLFILKHFHPTECIHFALPLWTSPCTGFGKAHREFPAARPVPIDSPSCSGGSRCCSDNVGSSLGTGKQSSWRLKSQR